MKQVVDCLEQNRQDIVVLLLGCRVLFALWIIILMIELTASQIAQLHERWQDLTIKKAATGS